VSESSRQGTRLHFLVISFCALRAHSNLKNTTWTPRRWIFKKYHVGTFQNMNPFESLYTARPHITSSWTQAVHKANANFLSTYIRLWFNRRSPRHCNHPILLLWASSRPTSFAIYSVVPRSRSMLRRRDGRQPLLNNGKSTYAYCKNSGSQFTVGMFYKRTAASGLQSIKVTIRTAGFMETEQHFDIEIRLRDGWDGVWSPARVKFFL